MASKFERMLQFAPIWANDFNFKNNIELFQVIFQKEHPSGIWIKNRFTQKNEERLKPKEDLLEERRNLSKWILSYFC